LTGSAGRSQITSDMAPARNTVPEGGKMAPGNYHMAPAIAILCRRPHMAPVAILTRSMANVESAMGAWGHGIRQDDFVCDVIGVFDDFLKAGQSVADATKAVKAKFAAEIEDSDDGPLFWIALADVQWTYGDLEPRVLNRVRQDFDSGKSLTLWTEDQRGLARRRAALEKFIAKIAEPNPRPKKPPKVVTRAPKFQQGDCLSIRLSNGQYGAALVLAADHSNVEYGKNLIGVLDYLSPEKPTVELFRKRHWLVRTHHSWNNEMDLAWYLYVGFRVAKDRLEIVGRIELLDSDPKDSNTSSGWGGIGEQVIMQREWDAQRN
jgi:hypothetical protein